MHRAGDASRAGAIAGTFVDVVVDTDESEPCRRRGGDNQRNQEQRGYGERSGPDSSPRFAHGIQDRPSKAAKQAKPNNNSRDTAASAVNAGRAAKCEPR